jgi:hypothetical protein
MKISFFTYTYIDRQIIMDNNWIRLTVIGVVALALYYAMSKPAEGFEDGSPNVGYQGAYTAEGFYVPPPNANANANPKSQVDSIPQAKAVPLPPNQATSQGQALPLNAKQQQILKPNTNVLPYAQPSNNYSPQASLNGQFQLQTGSQPALDCFPKDTLKPSELLPQDNVNNTWNSVNPSVPGHLTDRNFLESSNYFGINTQGSSLRNANLGLRSEPVIPKTDVGPWSQSTIDADTNRRQFEIGGDY